MNKDILLGYLFGLQTLELLYLIRVIYLKFKNHKDQLIIRETIKEKLATRGDTFAPEVKVIQTKKKKER